MSTDALPACASMRPKIAPRPHAQSIGASLRRVNPIDISPVTLVHSANARVA
jgi:hypothetical protein